MKGEVERYDENGEPISVIDGGPLKHLWKYLSIISENDQLKLDQIIEKFDYTEFFKRLYLSRAELDVTSSILELLLKEEVSDDAISLNIIHHESQLRSQYEFESDKMIFEMKNSFLKDISKDLKSSSEALRANRTSEHDMVGKVLLELRESFHWNLVRICTMDQVQINIEYQEMSPIIGIDYSPMALFKDSSSLEQYNYKSSHQIHGDNLALILRHNSGSLSLLFQSKIGILERTAVLTVIDLETNHKSNYILFEKSLLNMIELNTTSTLNDWNKLLIDARNRVICFNIMKLISTSASKYPQDIIDFSSFSTTVDIESKFQISIKFLLNADVVDSKNLFNGNCQIYNIMLKEYLCSSGSNVNWGNIRSRLLCEHGTRKLTIET